MDKVGRNDAVAPDAAERRRGVRLGGAPTPLEALDLLPQRHLAVARSTEGAQVARVVGAAVRVRHDVVALEGGLQQLVAQLAAPQGTRRD